MATNNSINTGKPIEVSNGGTGISTLTAYAPVIGGTTSTGPIQSASTGLSTSGYALTSTGSSSLPSFQPKVITTTLSVGSGNHVLNANTKLVSLWMWNAGGGGGSGRQGTTALSSGGGGGNGGALVYLNNLPVSCFGGAGATVAYVVPTGGLGGAAQTTAATNGNAGALPTSNISFGVYFCTPSGPSGATIAGGGNTANGNGGGWGGFLSFNGPTVGVNPTAGSGSSAGAGNGVAVSGITLAPYATSGGGGGGANSVTPRAGGNGGAITSISGSNIVAASAGGIETGTINGANGTNASSITNLVGGTGGGGGGGQSVGASAGTGGTGGTPGGGGGGGGGSLTGTNSGAGGNGGNGQITVIEYT